MGPAPTVSRAHATELVDRLLDDASNFDDRFQPDYEAIENIVREVRARDLRVVLTSGSFDILHEGHSMYLEAARDLGDFLIVGVDSDEKVRARKGPGRPVVPEQERLRMLTHQRGVGVVTLKDPSHARWALIKAVRPDILVATEETYTDEETAELAAYCGSVKVLPRMATVSTSARLRLMQLDASKALADRIAQALPELINRLAGEVS
jgi:D-beta-D-heptose 7-phosphate kinase/D-beta-D-heptose 1-phosphate adenosyltransferase